MLPAWLEVDDYSSCVENHNLFCKVRAKMSTFRNDTLKEYVKNLTQDMDLFDRSILHRSLCINKPLEFDENHLKAESETIINQRIKDYPVTINVEYIKCTDGKVPLSFYDYVILGIVLFYATFILISTYYERKHRNQQEKTGIYRLVSEFSIFYNWKKKTNPLKNEDSKNLLSMQGLRFFTMVLITFFHCFLIYVSIQISNPSFYEALTAQTQTQFFQVMNLHLVLNFFLMSSWLLVLQVNEIFEKYGEFTLKHIGIIILNRYFRLMTTAGCVVIFLHSSWPMRIFSGPLNFDLIQIIPENCKQHFIYDLLLFQNHLGLLEICNPVSWHIAADFQIYILTILLLYIWFKFKFNTIKYFITVFIFSLVVYGSILYMYNSNGVYLISARNSEIITQNPSQENLLDVTYLSTYSIFPASLIGALFGIIYFRYKNKTIKNTKFLSTFWALLFFGLPVLVLLVDLMEFPRIPAAIIGSVTKPLYSLGIASGIFGMSHNFGGRVKRIFEHKYAVLLGNFAYCSYISQYLFILGSHKNEPPFIDGTTMVTDALIFLCKAWILGIIISLTIEEPGLSMQKRILPQIKKYEIIQKKKE